MSPYGSIPASQDDTGEMWPLAHSTDAPSMDRAIQHVNGTDTTSLLLAQNNNNHANANPHQGSTSTGSENDAIQLLPLLRRGTFHSFNEALEEHVTGRRVRSRTLGLLLAVAIGAAGLVLSSTLISQSRSASSEDDVAALKLFGYTQDPRPPFSTLDPVHDLGLYDFNRPKSSKPSQVITFTKPSKKSYPTNTWYQSLLMVGSDEEPTVTHRAYAIPYVLDAAGPVPGLRVHPNHIDASSSVVQLYVIEEYGLTVGVAPLVAAAVTKSGSNQTVTHRYKVTHTTPIGLTLAWVRYLFVFLRTCAIVLHD